MAKTGTTIHDLYRVHAGLLGRGLTFFVDTELGASGNTGLEPDNALDTITAAIALCSGDRRDTVFVLDWQTDNGETWPIPMSVAGVTLQGMATGGPLHDSQARITCPNATAAIAITAHRCRIQHCYITTNASYDAITFAINGWTGIIGNFFLACADACGGGAEQATSIGWMSEIAHNWFSSNVADHGIYQYNPSHLYIHDNHFGFVRGAAALELEAGSYARIINNVFAMDSDTKGGAITLNRDVRGATINGNVANDDVGAVTANPFLDTGTGAGDNNVWLLNYRNITAALPAVI